VPKSADTLVCGLYSVTQLQSIHAIARHTNSNVINRLNVVSTTSIVTIHKACYHTQNDMIVLGPTGQKGMYSQLTCCTTKWYTSTVAYPGCCAGGDHLRMAPTLTEHVGQVNLESASQFVRRQ